MLATWLETVEALKEKAYFVSTGCGVESYAANRSALAIASGFGTKDRHARQEPVRQEPDRARPRTQAARKAVAA